MPNYCSVGCYCLAEIFKNEVTIVELVTECLGFVGFGLFLVALYPFFKNLILNYFEFPYICIVIAIISNIMICIYAFLNMDLSLFMLQVVLFFVWIILLIFRLITTCATVNCCEKK